ncbi:hypothetical protein [Sandaracinus amylolyticus]|uniref:Uncharacterized protein n=1 Tax=Sandaracinus amylolyticus TaxID=927083 RepID=A0A0F6YGZ2_9BACT|nr:hypothetical protein [Sandaracinus amylolyticus]AKF05257.1 hypothetical protein DB32_002406 [Sandaracinus amylolyticus]
MLRFARPSGVARSLATLALCALPACDDGDGEAGSLAFAYSTHEGPVDVATPIAVGSRATLVLDPRPGFAFGSIVEARSDTPTAVDVAMVDPRFVELLANGRGAARIDVRVSTGDDPDDEVFDTVIVESDDVARAVVSNACATEDEGSYLAGSSRISLPLELTAADGVALTGWGSYPFVVEPENTLRLDTEAGATSSLPLRAGQSPGVATITSLLDDADTLEVELVPEGAIDDAILVGGTGASMLPARTVGTVRIVPVVEGRPLCQGRPDRAIEVATPGVCRVVDDAEVGARSEVDPASIVRVEGFDRGTCRLIVTYSNANGGEGLERMFEIAIF